MWTKRQDEKLIEMKDSIGLTFREIATRLKRGSTTVQSRYYHLKYRPTKCRSSKRELWTVEETRALHRLKGIEDRPYSEIAKILNRSRTCVTNKFKSTDWDVFLYKEGVSERKIWDKKELYKLYDLRKNKNLSFTDVAEELKRSKPSIRHKYNRMNWKTFLENYRKEDGIEDITITQEKLDEQFKDRLTKSLLEISRHEPERLSKLTKTQFFSQIHLATKNIPISYTDLKRRALYELEQIGYCHPSIKKFGCGTYIIVGDTHGKHTRSGMFKMVKTLNDYIEADKIIHIGHMMDDDNDVNFHWKDFDNLVVIAREEELKFFLEEKYPDVVRTEVQLGNMSVQNQDLITDYVQTPLGSAITADYFEGSTIVNLHRHELDARCTPEGEVVQIASPGCLCEKHIVYTIKQQDYTDGRTVKQTFPTGYKKYRRMKHMFKKWEQGILVVHVNAQGDYQIIQCPILKTSKGYTTSYYNKIISEDYVIDPDEKGFVHGDLHIDKHDIAILDIQEQFCRGYKPSFVMNVGDTLNNVAINHHEFKKRSSTFIDKDILDEGAATNYIIKRIRTWAPNMYVMKGNHERFSVDLTDSMPQFATVLDFEFITGIKDIDITVSELKAVENLFDVKFIHGDIKLYGQRGGNQLDKLFRTFGRNCIMGHSHYPSTRSGCHIIGLTGQLNQDYNEVAASRWINGFAFVNIFEGRVFISNMAIVGNRIVINHKTITPKKLEKWTFKKYKAVLHYEFE